MLCLLADLYNNILIQHNGMDHIKFVIYVCPSVRQRGATRVPLDGFSWNLIWLFSQSSEKIQVSLNDNNNGTLYEDLCTFVIISRRFLRTRNVSDKSCVENQNTHFVVNSLFFENRAIYEIMWKNIVESDWPEMTVWRKRIACWMTKATNTHPEYVILIAFPLQQWLRERASLLRLTYIARLVNVYKTGCVLYEISGFHLLYYFSGMLRSIHL